MNDRHCFELYGYDIMIDSELKPWLIEVNASPSLSTTTESDRILKMGLINDTLEIVVPPEWFEDGSKRGSNLCTKTKVGNFSVIIDESTASDKDDKKNLKSKKLWH